MSDSVQDAQGNRQYHARWLVPIASLLAVLAAWEGLALALEVSRFVLPRPSALFAALAQHAPYLGANALVTLRSIVIGFALGLGFGIVVGLLIGLVPVLERSLFYVIVFLQTMPKVAIAPLLVVWLGHGLASKVVLVAIVTFVPILIDTIAGIRYVDQRILLVSRSMGASFMQTLVFVRLPAALPHVLAGIKTSLIIAVTVGIVVEYVAANDGLGYVAMIAMGNDDLPLVFAAIVVVAGIGFVLSGAAALFERWITPWRRP